MACGVCVVGLQRVPPAEAGSDMKDQRERGAEAPHYPNCAEGPPCPYSPDNGNSQALERQR